MDSDPIVTAVLPRGDWLRSSIPSPPITSETWVSMSRVHRFRVAPLLFVRCAGEVGNSSEALSDLPSYQWRMVTGHCWSAELASIRRVILEQGSSYVWEISKPRDERAWKHSMP